VNSTPTFTAIGDNNSKRSMDKHSPIWILTENEKKQRKKDNDMKKSWLPITLGVVLALVLGLALLGKMPTPFASKEATPAPTQEELAPKADPSYEPPVNDVPPTPTASLIPSPTATLTAVPTASLIPSPTAMVTPTLVTPTVLTGPVANRLKYDETGCDPQNLVACRINGQTEFPAIFVRRIQSGVLSLTQGIVAIQQLAAAAGVPTSDAWTTLTADPVYATFVWCPAGNCSYPPDTAFPLMGISGLANVQFSLAIVSAHSPSTPPASINTVTCPNGDCWSAPLQ